LLRSTIYKLYTYTPLSSYLYNWLYGILLTCL
jgi:hypothetical protein